MDNAHVSIQGIPDPNQGRHNGGMGRMRIGGFRFQNGLTRRHVFVYLVAFHFVGFQQLSYRMGVGIVEHAGRTVDARKQFGRRQQLFFQVLEWLKWMAVTTVNVFG